MDHIYFCSHADAKDWDSLQEAVQFAHTHLHETIILACKKACKVLNQCTGEQYPFTWDGARVYIVLQPKGTGNAFVWHGSHGYYVVSDFDVPELWPYFTPMKLPKNVALLR